MRTFLSTAKKVLKLTQESRGFTLLEILVALSLLTFTFLAVLDGTTSNRKELGETIDQFETAVRFSVNESILKRAPVRIRFNLEEEPHEYSIEFGPSTAFVLPELREFDELSNQTLAERERKGQLEKKVDQEFNRVQEFSDGPKKLPDDVKIIGVGSSLRGTIITEGNPSLYFYPTGEKDHGLIILATDEEIVWLNIEPFQNLIEREYQTFNPETIVDIDDYYEEQGKVIYEKWSKD